jgi:Flp pilus assembly protein TadG
MVSRWLLKLVIGIAVVGFALFELGSPFVTKAILDGNAHDAADDAAHEYFQNHDPARAQAVAQQDADGDGAKLAFFNIDDQGTVHVTLSKQAKSYVLHNFGPTKDWYAVQVSASAAPK